MMNDDDDDDIAAADIDEAPRFEQANANNNSHQIYTLAGAHHQRSPGSSSIDPNEGHMEPESSPDMYMHNAIADLKQIRCSRAMKSARESAATCANNYRAAVPSAAGSKVGKKSQESLKKED